MTVIVIRVVQVHADVSGVAVSHGTILLHLLYLLLVVQQLHLGLPLSGKRGTHTYTQTKYRIKQNAADENLITITVILGLNRMLLMKI